MVVGAVLVSAGTLAYLLFCPAVYWVAGGAEGHLSPVLIPAALIGAGFGAALGLCVAADRVCRDNAAEHLCRPQSLAAWERHLQRPRRRSIRERRKGHGRFRIGPISTGHV
jgi:hypothetical protein